MRRAALRSGTGLRTAVLLAAAVAVLAAWAGIGVRATQGGQAAVDEPQYLLSALSLWEDRSLDISDELADRRWTAFHDAELPVQTEPRADGSALSPHDPLLPLLLAVPVGLGGWVGAKVALGLLAGALAGLTVWTAVRRFAVPPLLAGVGVALAAASPPLAVYGQQVYPEVPAALAVVAAVAALTGPLRRGGLLLLALSVLALPWLSVKYTPVAAALALLAAVRLTRERRGGALAVLAGGFAAGGAAYLVVHRLLYGGWTVYAAGDHFARTGELSVVGVSPDYAGRSLRLVALLADRGYGLLVWQPAWLLVLPALGALLVARPRGFAALAVPLLAGWATATWVALTMHGYWWPGRQVVVVLPLAVLAVLAWLAPRPALAAPIAPTAPTAVDLGQDGPRSRRVAHLLLDQLGGGGHAGGGGRGGGRTGGGGVRRALGWAAAGLAGVGVLAYVWLVADGLAGRVTWVVHFDGVGDPLVQALRAVLPDYRTQGPGFWPLHVAWTLAAVALVGLGAVTARRRPTTPVPIDAPPTDRPQAAPRQLAAAGSRGDRPC